MKTFEQLVIENEDRLEVEYMEIIDNETLIKSFSFRSNLHADYGIQPDLMGGVFTNRVKVARKRKHFYQKATGKRFKLVATDNSVGYTRLIFSLK